MYKINIEFKPLVDMIRQIGNVEESTPLNLALTADYARNAVLRRVEKGYNAAGELMTTRSRNKIGRYSYRHGRKRQAAGLRTDRITLSFTGQMIRDFQAISTGDSRKADVGFLTAQSAEKAIKNERLFGDVFYLSAKEQEDAADFFVKTFNNFLR